VPDIDKRQRRSSPDGYDERVEPRIQYARASDGVTVAYTVHGTGPTMIWLPPVPFSNVVAQWRIPLLRAAYEALGRHLRVVLYDGRGTGQSQRDVEDLGLDAMIRDLEAVVASARLGRFALFGYYHSCLLAIAYAAAHPRQVSHLILFGGAARGWDAMAPAETQALLTLIERDWDLFTDAAAHAWLGWSAGETGRLMADAFRTATTPAAARSMLRIAGDTDVSSDLARIQVPALVLHRQGERQIPVDVSRQLATALPNGTLRELPGSTATLFVEDLEGDIRVIVDFLTDGAQRSPSPPSRQRSSDTLTPRELEVLRLVAGGETNAEVARRLGLSVHTIERHLANVYPKIGARGRSDATAYAVRRGIV
jgi:pimeloyl-ACP methyl ester carboxylesterase/DNA-binding CsgD family transcriptional regulator